VQARRRLLRLRCASGWLGTSLDLSSSTPPRAGSSSTTPPRAGSSSTTPPRAGSSSTSPPPPRIRVPQHVARLVTRLVAPLVVDNSASRRLIIDYFASASCPGASARPAARHAARRAARRRLLRLAQARRRLLRLRCASGCLGTSAAHRLSSTTSPTPRAWVPWHVRGSSLVVDYFAYAVRPVASAHHTARRVVRCAARHRLLRLRRAFGCLSTSRGPSHGSSTTTPCAATLSCGHAGSTSATPCVVTTCLAATLARLRAHRTPPRRRLPVASRRPFISTSFPN
jgi:hypothetical protein